jgi:serine/threonine protein kinase
MDDPEQTLPASPSAAAPSAGTGEVYASRYRIDRLLGRGGMGQVFRVHDVVNDVDLALKILNASDEPDRNERFKREIGILSRINHVTVPRVVDWGLHDGHLFFVSEFVDGHDLRSEIQRHGPWPAADAAALAATVADGLAAAHGAAIVHRDVKPSNIMIATDGSVRLLDFGLARATGIDTTTLTRTGMIVGTPTYMSPEQFESHWVDERSDIYSLGIVLFELLTGRPPFTGSTMFAVAMMHKNDLPPSPRSVRGDIPAWIDRIVLKCLEKRPEKRFASAAVLAAELRRPHEETKQRRLPSGDIVVEDDADTGEWSLVLKSAREKAGWSAGMTLFYYDRYYKLHQIAAPSPGSSEWTYQLMLLPQTEVIRKYVDYREDCGQQRHVREKRSLLSAFTRFVSRRKG